MSNNRNQELVYSDLVDDMITILRFSWDEHFRTDSLGTFGAESSDELSDLVKIRMDDLVASNEAARAAKASAKSKKKRSIGSQGGSTTATPSEDHPSSAAPAPVPTGPTKARGTGSRKRNKISDKNATTGCYNKLE